MEELTAKNHEIEFIIECNKYFDLQLNNQTNSPMYDDLGIKLNALFMTLQRVADDENYPWEFCNIHVYQKKLDTKKGDLFGASRATILDDIAFYNKELKDFKRKREKVPNRNNFYSESDTIIPFNYFFKLNGRKQVILDFLDSSTNRDINVNERRKYEYITELLVNAGKNCKKTIEEENISFLEFINTYGNIFKDLNSLKLFNYISKEFQIDSLQTKYSCIYRFLKSNNDLGEILCNHPKYKDFLLRYQNIKIKKVYTIFKMKKYKPTYLPQLKTIVKAYNEGNK